jgi:hypothetical protein
MRKPVIALVALVALTGIIVLAAEIPADKEVIVFEAKLGKMTFKHSEHADRIGDCTTCHHKVEGDAVPQPCSACHMPKEEKDGAPKLKNAVHDSCQGCHQEKVDAGEKAGPVKGAKECKKCHIKETAAS